MKFEKWIATQGDQKDVARRLGVSVSAVSRWVRGNRIPRYNLIVKIERLSGGKVTFASFVKGVRK